MLLNCDLRAFSLPEYKFALAYLVPIALQQIWKWSHAADYSKYIPIAWPHNRIDFHDKRITEYIKQITLYAYCDWGIECVSKKKKYSG